MTMTINWYPIFALNYSFLQLHNTQHHSQICKVARQTGRKTVQPFIDSKTQRMTRNIILDANLESLSDLISMLQDYRLMDCSSLTLSVFMGLLRTSASSLVLSLKGILEDRKVHFLLTFLAPKQLGQLNY